MTYSVVLPDRTVRSQLGLAELGRLTQQGVLTRETLVWCEGWPAWMPAGQVSELAPILGSAPAPVSVPVALPVRTPAQAVSVATPAAGSMVQRKYWVLTFVAVAFFLVALAGFGFLAWRLLGPPTPPVQGEQTQASSSVNPARPVSASEARVVLDNQGLLLEAARFRGLASSKLDDALKAFGSPASLEFLRSSEVGREAPHVWAYFFSCSLLLIGHAQDSAPVIGFYNPFLDAALLTRWSWKGDQATISDATLWVGTCFPDGQAAAPQYPRWMSTARTTPLHEALLAGEREFVSRFDREFPIQPVDSLKFPQPGRRAEAQTFIEQQAAAQLLTLMKLRTHRGLANLRRALAEGRASALDALIPQGSSFNSATLLKLPRELRERLLPSFALCSAEHTIVVLSLPALPRFYILAQFGNAESPLEHLSVQELN